MKVSDSLDNVPNEHVVTQQVTDRQTNQVTDQLLELLEWLFATKNSLSVHKSVLRFYSIFAAGEYCSVLLAWRHRVGNYQLSNNWL